MRFVLDSSVALKLVLPEQGSAEAIRLRDEFVQGLHQLLAPDIFPIELGHAPARAERRGILHPPEGTQRLAELLAILPDLYRSLPLLPRAFDLASAARIGVYDCRYLALAEHEQCEFLTADRKLFSFAHVRPFPYSA
jgi:predicted nucleic acid-binding protein